MKLLKVLDRHPDLLNLGQGGVAAFKRCSMVTHSYIRKSGPYVHGPGESKEHYDNLINEYERT